MLDWHTMFVRFQLLASNLSTNNNDEKTGSMPNGVGRQ